MNIQTIQALDGQKYVLLPLAAYVRIKDEIDSLMDNDTVPFVLSDYVDNPIALKRIESRVTQKELANALNVSQAYISKIENLDHVKSELLEKIESAIASIVRKK